MNMESSVSSGVELGGPQNEVNLALGRDLGHASQLVEKGRPLEAEIAYRVILRMRPDNYDALSCLSQLVLKRGDSETAIGLLRKALGIKPMLAEAHKNLANALRSATRCDEALEHYQRAIIINQNDPDAHFGHGITLRTLGRLDEAVCAFERAIALDPSRTGYYLNLGLTKEIEAGDPFIQAVERHAQAAGQFAPDEQIALSFLLGKINADLGLMKKSFDHLLTGNTLRRQRLLYDEGNTLRGLERIRSFYTAELIEDQSGRGCTSELPIFILGMPRAGTTLVEQILASHPAVYGAGEVRKPIPKIEFRPAWPNPVSLRVGTLDVSENTWQQSGSAIVERLAAIAPGTTRIIDKDLLNFQHAALFHLALPNARMIHVVRDPVDTCLSCFSIHFAEGSLPQTYDLGELGRYYKAYTRLMDHWRKVLPAGAIFEVRYEDIVADLEGQARRLVAYCGLEWNDACLEFHKTNRPVHTASAVQVRHPIYKTSVGRWRPSEELLRPLLTGLSGE
jgi:Sulfotransferase family/Tetratricopeptide repeat